MDERKRDSMIAYLRHRMEQFEIDPDDLATAIASDQARQSRMRYRSAIGDEWSGEGDMPQWLRQAISAGQSLEHFALTSKPPLQQAATKKVNWRDVPFSGSPLARQNFG
jgi:DNA-binding protein H-NS